MAESSNEIIGFTIKKLDEDAHDDMLGQIPSSGTGDVGEGVDEMRAVPIVVEARGDATPAGGDPPVGEMRFVGPPVRPPGYEEDTTSSSPTMESVIDGMDTQPANLPMEMRVGYMEVQVETLKVEVAKIKSRMHDLIDTQNGMLDKQVGEVKNVVTMAEFEKMVDLAVTSGTKYGVSRRYITRFLCGEHGQEDSRYLQKKLGVVLKRKLASNEYLLSDSLFKINKN